MKIEDKKRVLREMVLHRRFEERCYQAYIERKIGKCLPISGIAGVQAEGRDRLLLFMRDRRIVSAALRKPTAMAGTA